MLDDHIAMSFEVHAETSETPVPQNSSIPINRLFINKDRASDRDFFLCTGLNYIILFQIYQMIT